MSAELLERATRALRSSTEPADGGEAALQRALGRLQRAERVRPRERRWLRTAAWTLAATLAGAGAWAHATGKVAWFASLAEPAAAPTAPAPARVEARRRAVKERAPEPEIAAPAIVDPAIVEAPAIVDPAIVEAPVPQLVPVRPRVAAPKAEPKPKPAAPEVAVEHADELYREAHVEHFTRRDYAAALAAWDRYLAAAGPAHRWAVEARFNRGVALFRLGQKEAARHALRPFAEGEYGSYRREEAARLLEALRAPQSAAPGSTP